MDIARMVRAYLTLRPARAVRDRCKADKPAQIAPRYVYVPMFPTTGTRKIISVERSSEADTAARHSGVDWPI